MCLISLAVSVMQHYRICAIYNEHIVCGSNVMITLTSTNNKTTMHTISSAERVGGCSSTTPDGYLGTACPNNR